MTRGAADPRGADGLLVRLPATDTSIRRLGRHLKGPFCVLLSQFRNLVRQVERLGTLLSDQKKKMLLNREKSAGLTAEKGENGCLVAHQFFSISKNLCATGVTLAPLRDNL